MSHPISRRKLLPGATVSLAGVAAASQFIRIASSSTHALAASAVSSDPFIHRGYLGWIRDLSSTPRPNDQWPSLVIDQGLFNDYTASATFMQQSGLNEVSLWGLFTDRNWSLDVENTIDATRADQVRMLIKIMRDQGMKVFSGLGLYSWGFDAIIQANPSLSDGQNLHAMCLSNNDSWTWQKRVIDYVFSFPIDGVEMQSADQGRCHCADCAAMGDTEYYSLVNNKATTYIKQNWPNNIVGMSNWGMNFSDPTDLQHVVTMTRGADFLIDITDTVRQRDPAYRKTLIDAIRPCTFGSLGAPYVEGPQHWHRDRWFLPTVQRASANLLALYADGGRAVENYMRITDNPSDEVSIWVTAKLEANPDADWKALLQEVLGNIYGPQNADTLTSLVNLFLNAEDAYFTNAYGYSPSDYVELEPLVSSSVGAPIYITEHMGDSGKAGYRTTLQQLHTQAQNLVSAVTNQGKMSTIVRCIENVLADLG